MNEPKPNKVPRTLRKSTAAAAAATTRKRFAQRPVFAALRDALAVV